MKNNSAFSLVEMMVSLVAVSVLLAAFVPVITKRVKPKVNIASSTSRITNNCSEKFSADCILCDGTKKCYICNKTCPIGTYRDSDTCSCKSCTTITPRCTACSNNGTCNACSDGYLLKDNTCTNCPEGHYCKDGVKYQCPKGTYGKNAAIRSTCTPCPAGTYSEAVGATSSSVCETCPEGTYSLRSASSCTNCAPGKWSTSGRTTACSDECPAGYACKNGVKTYCEAGTYALNKGNSVCKSCTSNHCCLGGSNAPRQCGGSGAGGTYCLQCDRETCKCTNCKPGYRPVGTSCSGCPTNCLSCTSDGCTTCKDNYYVVDGACSWSCPPYCKSCDTNHYCSECYTGYSLSDGRCVSNCPSTCTGCNSNGRCNGCINGYHLSNGRCVVDCPAICTSCNSDGSCRGCISGYELSGGSCVREAVSCPSTCTGCNSYGSCTGCISGYTLSGGSCVSAAPSCPSTCTSCNSYGSCTGCISGYELSGGSCVSATPSCPSNCTSCIAGGCTACAAGYTLLGNQLFGGTCCPSYMVSGGDGMCGAESCSQLCHSFWDLYTDPSRVSVRESCCSGATCCCTCNH